MLPSRSTIGLPQRGAMKLTKSVVEKLPLPTDSPTFYRDEEIRGFGIKVFTTGAKTFFLEKKINGRSRRMSIGRFGEVTAEQARKEAIRLAGQIVTGGDPVADKAQKRMASKVLREVFETYMTRRDLKPQTLLDIRRCMNEVYPDWLDKAFVRITPDMIVKRHAEYGQQHSAARANLAMRYLRAIFNFAMVEYTDAEGRSLLEQNPVRKLSLTKGWYRIEQRRHLIRPHELGAWFRAVRDIDNPVLRDYLTLLVLTGLRRQEAATLTWTEVDLIGKTLTIPDPKNRQPHTLPLSDFLYAMLQAAHARRINEYVFPGNGASGHLVEPRKQIAKVVAACGIPFTPHDLRRTFATVAESLDIPAYAVKALLNHKQAGDVTQGYLQISPERLRRPMQTITDYLLGTMGQAGADGLIET